MAIARVRDNIGKPYAHFGTIYGLDDSSVAQRASSTLVASRLNSEFHLNKHEGNYWDFI